MLSAENTSNVLHFRTCMKWFRAIRLCVATELGLQCSLFDDFFLIGQHFSAMTFTAYSCHCTNKMVQVRNMPLNVCQLLKDCCGCNSKQSFIQTRWEGQKSSTNVSDEMKTVSMDALLANEWVWAKNRQRKYSPEVTHLACLSGISNSEGQKWEQNKKGFVLSQAGRARRETARC